MKVGDRVFLKSGGPEMTISGLVGIRAICVWFNDIGLCEGHFPCDCLCVL